MKNVFKLAFTKHNILSSFYKAGTNPSNVSKVLSFTKPRLHSDVAVIYSSHLKAMMDKKTDSAMKRCELQPVVSLCGSVCTKNGLVTTDDCYKQIVKNKNAAFAKQVQEEQKIKFKMLLKRRGRSLVKGLKRCDLKKIVNSSVCVATVRQKLCCVHYKLVMKFKSKTLWQSDYFWGSHEWAPLRSSDPWYKCTLIFYIDGVMFLKKFWITLQSSI